MTFPFTRYIVILLFLAVFASGQTSAELKERVRSRSQAVAALQKNGTAKESATGLLTASVPLDALQAQTVQEENRDRQVIFGLIGKKFKVTPDEVALLFAGRARKMSVTFPVTNGGPCNLTSSKSADTARLLQYLKQGMNYAALNKPEAALAEFRQALAIDKNFLGLNQNAASALSALKKYDESESALKDELKLIGCLAPMPDPSLQRFAYMMEVPEQDPVKRSALQVSAFRIQLEKVKASSQYNLACIYSIQRKKESSIEALRAAVKSGFDNRKALISDSDLAFIRPSPEFREILSSAESKKR